MQSWQVTTAVTSNLGKDFLYAFGKYYARPNGRYASGIYHSSDALHWSYFRAGYSVAYGNGRLVIVKYGGGNLITEVTTDGAVFNTYTTSNVPSASTIAFGNGRFVVVSASSGYEIRTSSDGIHWTSQTIPSTLRGGFTDVSYSGGRFVARGMTAIATSTDGINWEDITFHAWKDNVNMPFHLSGGNGIWLLTHGFGLRLTEPSSIELITDIVDQDFTQVRYHEGAFWALSDTTDNIITGSLWKSEDGENWEAVYRFPFRPQGLTWLGSKLILCGQSSGKIAISENTTDWDIVETDLFRIRSLAVFSGTVYAGQQKGLYRSSDGINWTRETAIPEDDVLVVISSSLGVTVSVTDGYGRSIYHSSDGANWTESYTESAFDGAGAYNIAYIGSKLLADTGDTGLIQSVDGLTWELIPDARDMPLGQLSETDSFVYNVGQDGIYRSAKQLPYLFSQLPTCGDIKALAHGHNLSVAVGHNGSLYKQDSESVDIAPVESSTIEAGSRHLSFDWEANGTPIAGYSVRYREDETTEWSALSYIPGTATSISIDGLTPSSTYEISIATLAPGTPISHTPIEGSLTTISPREEWRRNYFGSIENSGMGADFVDGDQDRMPNLMEYTFGLNPKQADAPSAFFTYSTSEDPTYTGFVTLTLNFWCDANKVDVTYIVEESKDLITWREIARSTGGARFSGNPGNISDPYYPHRPEHILRQVEAKITTNTKQRFLRLSVVPN